MPRVIGAEVGNVYLPKHLARQALARVRCVDLGADQVRYLSNLIVLAGGVLLLFLGMTTSSLPQFVVLYMTLGGTAFIVCAIVMFFATLREHL